MTMMPSTLLRKTGGGHRRIQKENTASFSKLDIAFEKNQIKLGRAQSRSGRSPATFKTRI